MWPFNKIGYFLWAFFLFIEAMLSFGCNTSDKSKTYSAPYTEDYVPDYLADTCFLNYNEWFSIKSVEEFYKNRNYKVAWSNQKKLTTEADSLIKFIRESRKYGLYPNEYHLSEIEVVLQHIYRSNNDTLLLAQIDKILTDSYLTLGYHLKNGRVNNKNLERLSPPQIPDSMLIENLEKALMSKNIKNSLEQLEPDHEQYHLLKNELQKKLDLLTLPVDDIQDEIFNELSLIEINLERWRLEEVKFPDRHIFINIPAYHLFVKENDSKVLDSRIIVGKPATPTPILSSTIECFTIYPYWSVPRSIATQELLPKIKKDVNYLNTHNYQILDGKGNVLDPEKLDWENYNSKNFPFLIRQTEGNHNALGVVKFIFDNKYSVFLHDTNARSLFKKEVRAMSHGCIRLEKYMELANYLLKEDSQYEGPDQLNLIFNKKQRKTINLENPIPIYTRYFTAEAVGDTVVFYKDIYKKDQKLINSLYINKINILP